MGRSAGPGSPISFQCAQRRKDKWKYVDLRTGYYEDMPKHEVVRTGRTKKRSGRGAVGVRSMHESHEYRCSCGHVGWSNHVGIMQQPVDIDGLREAKGWTDGND